MFQRRFLAHDPARPALHDPATGWLTYGDLQARGARGGDGRRIELQADDVVALGAHLGEESAIAAADVEEARGAAGGTQAADAGLEAAAARGEERHDQRRRAAGRREVIAVAGVQVAVAQALAQAAGADAFRVRIIARIGKMNGIGGWARVEIGRPAARAQEQRPAAGRAAGEVIGEPVMQQRAAPIAAGGAGRQVLQPLRRPLRGRGLAVFSGGRHGQIPTTGVARIALLSRTTISCLGQQRRRRK